MNRKGNRPVQVKRQRKVSGEGELENSQEELLMDLDDFQRSLISKEEQVANNSKKPQKTAHMSIIDNIEDLTPALQLPSKTPPPPSLPKSLLYLTLTTSLLTISLLYIIKRKSQP